MVSRLLADLDDRIARTRDPIRNDCLRAERATLLARQGRLEQARTDLEQIRSRHRDRPHAVVTAWICLGEGMVGFYGNLGRESRDRFARAHALASAASNRSVRNLSSAWLAHFDYLNQDFQPMLGHLEGSVSECLPDEHLALERSSLVVAQGYHWAGRFDLARPWYSRARQHAVALGDETHVSALMHNMAWLHVAEARAMTLRGLEENKEIELLLLSANSTSSFDQHVGTRSLTSLVPMLRAHVLSLLNRHSEALEIFEANLAQALTEGLASIECTVLAEVAWCQACVGRLVDAAKFASLAEAKLKGCAQPDEIAATSGRLAQVFRVLGADAASRIYDSNATRNWAVHALRQAEVVALLTGSTAVQLHKQHPLRSPSSAQ